MPQTVEFRKVLSEVLDMIEAYESNCEYVIDFTGHCRSFCKPGPMEGRYALWSHDLGIKRDAVMDEESNRRVASAIDEITELIHGLEYGATQHKHVDHCRHIRSQLAEEK